MQCVDLGGRRIIKKYITKFLSTYFVQWIVIGTYKSMHLVFHAKKGRKLE